GLALLVAVAGLNPEQALLVPPDLVAPRFEQGEDGQERQALGCKHDRADVLRLALAAAVPGRLQAEVGNAERLGQDLPALQRYVAEKPVAQSAGLAGQAVDAVGTQVVPGADGLHEKPLSKKPVARTGVTVARLEARRKAGASSLWSPGEEAA